MRGLKRTAAGLAAIALSAGALAGCGSSGDTASSAADNATSVVESVASDVATGTTAAVTKEQYTAEVNKICTKIDDTVNALENQDANTAAQLKAQLAKITAAAQQGVQQLEALTPPADLQAAHDALVSSSNESIALSSKLTQAIEDKKVDTATLEAQAKEAAAIAKKQEAAAKELGLSNCFTGEGSDTADTDDAG